MVAARVSVPRKAPSDDLFGLDPVSAIAVI